MDDFFESGGEFEEAGVVHEGEGLEGGVAADAAGAGGEAIRGVEDGEGGRWGGAVDEGVEAAAVFVVAFADGPGAFDLALAHDAIGDGRIDWGAADLRGEQAAGGEGDVAHDFGVEAEAGLAGEEVVAGVFFAEVGAVGGALAVGAGGDDEAVDVFEAPVFGEEFGGEPVEEFGVGGGGALHAEVVFGFDEAASEVLLPDAVDDDACGEGVFRADDPFGEIEAVGLKGGGLEGVEDAGGAGSDFVGGAGEVAFDEDGGFAGFGEFLHDQGGDALVQEGIDFFVAVVEFAEGADAPDAGSEQALGLGEGAFVFGEGEDFGEEG